MLRLEAEIRTGEPGRRDLQARQRAAIPGHRDLDMMSFDVEGDRIAGIRGGVRHQQRRENKELLHVSLLGSLWVWSASEFARTLRRSGISFCDRHHSAIEGFGDRRRPP